MKSKKSQTANADSRPPKVITPPAHRPDPEAIRRRAHEIFERRGGSPGQELDDWLAAERELKAQRQRS